MGRQLRKPRDFRRLQITRGGWWYLALTIAAGVVALVSGNNVLYLIESLLLGGLILSGVVSERIVSAVEVSVRRLPAAAGTPSRDRLTVRNTRGFSLFCVEIGEWRDGRFEPFAFFARLGPRSRTTALAQQILPRRGVHRWEGLAIATSYPFGFARKLKIIREAGERIVWPSDLGGTARDRRESVQRRFHSGAEHAEGEVRPMAHEDDYRGVVWTLSARGETPMIRLRSTPRDAGEVTLELHHAAEAFEEKVVEAAQPFHRSPGERESREESARTLVLIGRNGRRKLRGRARVLNELAVVQPEGRAANGRKPA